MPGSSDQPASNGGHVSLADVLSALTAVDYRFVQLTQDGEITAVNDAFVDVTGVSREESLQAPFAEFLSSVPASAEPMLSEGTTVEEP